MKKIVEAAQAELHRNRNDAIHLERISGSLLRIIYNTSIYPYVDRQKLENIVAETGTGGYAVADTRFGAYGIVAINFNTTESPEYARPMYEQVIEKVVAYVKTCGK